MTPEQFTLFYQTIHGYPPFPWQLRLLRQVVEKGWPSTLALPTASGKTSAIDVAVFALALQAGQSLRERSAPLRIFFVIDRRLVVDQARDHARKLKGALENPEQLEGSTEGKAVVTTVATALRKFGGPLPLQVVALRGAMYRDDTWTKLPNQPTVCVSTVDQVGSRLLFRGYGVSEYARPVHAALTGNDALYLVDEAHLSEPFLQTLRAIEGYRCWPDREPIGGPFHVVEVSATPHGEAPPFRLDAEDLSNEELSRRLNVPKPVELVEPSKFEEEAARLAVEAQTEDVKVVGIVVNRVASAREIFRRLPGEPFEDKVLLTGRIRPWDRDQLLARFLGRVRAGRERHPEDRPLFVAATMTVEVGADLDFDFLLTEAAPLSSLRQRFGRLDRLGRFGKAAGEILLRKAKGPDPIYGEELAETWTWLRQQPNLDFGVSAFNRLLESASAPPVSAPEPAPHLFPAHLDSLVQTSPAPVPSPDVAPFLHGMEALDSADVQVVWRADLRVSKEDWLEVVAAAPPRSQEALPVPITAVRNWLREGPRVEVADLEGVSPGESASGEARSVLRWRGPSDDSQVITDPDDLRPGDTVVVPSEYGGADEFGWDPGSKHPVSDVGDLCVNAMANQSPDDRARLIRLRLYDGEGQPSITKVRAALDAGEEVEEALGELLDVLTDQPSTDPLLTSVVRAMSRSRPRVALYPAGIILSARVRPGFFAAAGESDEVDDSTATDDAASFRGGVYSPAQVTLKDHTDGVVRWVRSFVDSLGLDSGLRDVLIHAASVHDIGKADPRFQFVLYGDEPGVALLAKSGKDLWPAQQKAVWERSGLSRGFRHEFLSVALLRSSKGGHTLVEYLVGTHHGRGRPFVPFIKENGHEVILDWEDQRLCTSANHGLWHLKSGWADTFWKLVREHGYWGLAYLETVLRLADGARSSEEQRGA